MGARERFREYAAMAREAEDLRRRARKLEALADSCGDADEALRAASAAARYAALAEEIEEERAAVEIEIERIGRADWARVLRLRYVDGLSVEATARAAHYSRRSVMRIISAAFAELDR